jgi:hypothetical protein
MLKLVNIVFFIFLMMSAKAQNHHFIYFESQQNKPFSLKHENKIYNSGKKNYINLSKLENGNVQIKLDVETEKDVSFTIPINNNDAGFVLKQNENKDWILFSITDFSTIKQDKFIEHVVENTVPTKTVNTVKTSVASIENVDSSKIINKEPSVNLPKLIVDSSQINSLVIQTTHDIIKNKPKEPEQELSSLLIDSSKISNTTIQNKTDSLKENSSIQPANDSIILNSTFEKILEVKKVDGIEQKFIERKSNNTDTISIFIPFKKTIATDTVKEITKPLVEEKKMVSSNLDVVSLKENNCIEIASELDYNNFIKELQKSAVIKNKLNLAATVLNTKCFTTSQIQRLSVLFMYDKAKLDFFKLAFNHVADIKNFHYLENEIKDDSMRQEFLDLLKP